MFVKYYKPMAIYYIAISINIYKLYIIGIVLCVEITEKNPQNNKKKSKRINTKIKTTYTYV